ncbi:DUF5954 family protein [Streptomyces gardneri]|uniref:DUF5954 family protein n=1 Tax=Streptomyces gardneri TaxID=66892 RepID=UPI003698C904
MRATPPTVVTRATSHPGIGGCSLRQTRGGDPAKRRCERAHGCRHDGGASEEGAGSGECPLVVRVSVEPVEAAMEADAGDAAVRHGALAVRGPLFGVATQDQAGGRRWRVVVEVAHGCPQQARDALNSLLWFQAKCRHERRPLLAAVARLEKDSVDELTVLGTRYGVGRAEEYAALDGRGGIETPRPTDPERLTPDWSPGAGARSPRVDDGLVLDPDAPASPL